MDTVGSAATPGHRDEPGSPTGVAAVVAAVGIMLVAANLRPPVVAVAPLIDDIKADLAWSSAVAGLLTALPVLVFGLIAPVAPKLAARFGIERTIFGSMLVLAVAIVIRLVPHPVALFGGSALAGAGIGICNVVLPSLIKRDFAHRSGLMTGLYSMTLSAGAAVSAGLAVPLNDAVGGNWRVALALWVVPVVVAIVTWTPQLRVVHHGAAVSSMRSLLRDRIAWAITIFMAAQSFIFYTFSAWLPQNLIDRGMSPSAAGAVLAGAQVAGLVMSLVAPIIAGRFADQRIVTFIALLVTAIGFVGFVGSHSWPAFWALCVIAGPGASIGLALLFMVERSSSTAQTSQVSGMSQSIGYIVAAIGPVAIGAMHDATESWSIAMGVLGLALIPQAIATWTAANNVTMPAAR